MINAIKTHIDALCISVLSTIEASYRYYTISTQWGADVRMKNFMWPTRPNYLTTNHLPRYTYFFLIYLSNSICSR